MSMRSDRPSRGYSIFHATGLPSVIGPSATTNVLIKKQLPARGVVSSNPKRVERLIQRCVTGGLLVDVTEHTNAGWGVIIYTAFFEDVEIFIAGVPMGAAGSGFAFFEMYAAGAQAIIRYGSNDRKVSVEDLRTIVLVDKADNLVGLPLGSGVSATPDRVIRASKDLVRLLEERVKLHDLPLTRMICHNVEDYHAYNFSEFFETEDEIQAQIERIECGGDCWDMETAALFWRAEQFGLHAATVLQNLLKKPGTSPYEGEHGKMSLEMEHTFYQVIFEVLSAFSPHNEEHDESETTASFQESYLRANRYRASNDEVGVEEPTSSCEIESEKNNPDT